MKKLTMLGIGHPFVGDFSTEIVQGNHVRGWIFHEEKFACAILVENSFKSCNLPTSWCFLQMATMLFMLAAEFYDPKRSPVTLWHLMVFVPTWYMHRCHNLQCHFVGCCFIT